MDRSIERATERLEANRCAGQSILNLRGELPFTEVIVGVKGGFDDSEELPSPQQKKPRSISDDFLSSAADDEKFMQEKKVLTSWKSVSRYGV